jgi:hypothetical protein
LLPIPTPLQIFPELEFVRYLDQEVDNVTVFPLMKVLPENTDVFYRSAFKLQKSCEKFLLKVARAGERTRNLLVFRSFIFKHSSAEPQRLLKIFYFFLNPENTNVFYIQVCVEVQRKLRKFIFSFEGVSMY